MLVLLLTLIACTSGPSASPPITASPSSRVGPPSTEPAPPLLTRGLAAILECDGPVSSVGGFAEHFGPSGGGGTANAAFAKWLDRHDFALPRSGYVLAWSDEDHAIYVHGVWGEVKVVVVVSTRLGGMVGAKFTVDEVRACDAAEFGEGDVAGQREWSNPDTGEVLLEIAGHEHCDWQTIRFLDLTLDGEPRQYVRDPLSLLPRGVLMTTLARDVELPAGAAFSGYRSGGLELWLTPSDEAAFIVSSGGVERWPRAREPLGCV